MICSLCPHRCQAERNDREGFGRCRMPSLPRIARAALHHGEEPCISGTNGSGTVFFSGCSLSCVFCQNAPISHEDFGRTVSVEQLADCFRRLEAEGAHNINLVNPTHYAHSIRQALECYRPSIPIVYNSSGYERVETVRSLDGLIDVYLPDYKYADNALATALSGIENYRETALEAIAEMLRQTGPITLQNGLAVGGTMVRHLVLPGHTCNSLQALNDLHERFGSTLWVSLLFQYTPMRPHPDKALNRTLTPRECRKVFDHLCALEFENGYAQELSSATAQLIPSFDLTGV